MSDLNAMTATGLGPSGHHGEHGDLEVWPKEIAVGVVIGRVGEFFDFFVYGIASVIVFPALFFPNSTPYEGLFYSFAIFALGFVARLPGALIFRIIHDRYGRGAKLSGSLMLLGTSTVVVAFLPGTAEIGAIAIVLLTLLRIMQGLAVGGSWDGMPSLLALSAPEDKRGTFAMISQIGAPLGFLVATGMFAYLATSVKAAEFVDWGWRFAFFTAFAINVVTLFVRLRMSVTPEFEALLKAKSLTPSPLDELLQNYRRDITLGAMVPLASYALFHLVTIVPLTWAILDPDNYPLGSIFFLQIIGTFLCFVSMIISGRVADKVGRARTMWYGTLAIAAFCLPAPILGDTIFGAQAFILSGFVLLGFSQAQAAGAVNCCYDAEHRYSGALVTNELGWVIGAAFAPLIALVLADMFGNGGVAIYLAVAAIASLYALRLNLQRIEFVETHQED